MASHVNQGNEPPPYSSLLSTTRVPPFPYRQSGDRALSTSSLGGPVVTGDGRRLLLLVYLHGFMGNETSFQDFPAHVHNMVSPVLAGSHTVHTKIYPRYRSKKSIQLAATELSSWLVPHESSNTDIVLLGHSMGGLLLAELVLLSAPEMGQRNLKHRILGTISFDTPFLGMHPGIIKSGLSSIFQSAPTPSPAGPTTGQSDQPMNLDPNFNPAFFNDNRLPVRTAWRNAAHFLNKHSSALISATRQTIASHVEFGACLADYDGLKTRYRRLRVLEEESASQRQTVLESASAPLRVRFANYYTASPGRPKKVAIPVTDAPSASVQTGDDLPKFNQESDVLLATPMLSEKGPEGAIETSDGETHLSEISDLSSLDDLDLDIDDPALTTSPTFALQRGLVTSSGAQPKPCESPGERSDQVPPNTEPPENGRKRGAQSPASPSPHQQLTDAALRAYEAEQAAMPVDPEPPGPPPNHTNFPDGQAYRHTLSEHGRASKTYFKELQMNQRMQYDRFVAESRAKIESHRAAIKKLNVLIVEEQTRFATGVAENARIVAEINDQSTKSRINHQKLKLDHQRGATRGAERSSQIGQTSTTIAQRQSQRTQLKQMARQTRSDRRSHRRDPDVEARSSQTSSTPNPTIDDFGSATDDQAGEEIMGSMMHVRTDDEGATNPAGTKQQGSKESGDSYDLETAPVSPSVVVLDPVSPRLDAISRQTTPSQVGPDSAEDITSYNTVSSNQHISQTRSVGKDRVFCVLPPADARGNRDPTWMRTFMEDMDEVSAHTSLFLARSATEHYRPGQEWSERYSRFVCDVAEKIEEWVGDDLTRRVMEGIEEQGHHYT